MVDPPWAVARVFRISYMYRNGHTGCNRVRNVQRLPPGQGFGTKWVEGLSKHS